MEKILQIKAETLKEAKAQMIQQIPAGMYLVALDEVEPAPQRHTVSAKTVEDAVKIAKGRIPAGITEVKKRIIQDQQTDTLLIAAWDEEEAIRRALKDRDNTFEISKISIFRTGRQGVYRFFGRPGLYFMEICRKAIVQVDYMSQAVISATVTDDEKLAEKAFLQAAESGNCEIVETLLYQGVNINSRTPSGKNALMLCVSSGHFAMGRMLVDFGIDVHLTDEKGHTVLNFINPDDYPDPSHPLYKSARQLMEKLSKKLSSSIDNSH